jgi:hypothetical protein
VSSAPVRESMESTRPPSVVNLRRFGVRLRRRARRIQRVAFPLRVAARRAIAVYVLTRVSATVLMSAISGLGSQPNPAAFGCLLGIVGFLDVRRRREDVFWQNLGYAPAATSAVFAIVAVAGEIALARWII